MKKFAGAVLKATGLAGLLAGVTLIAFIVIHLAPGGPTGAMSDFNPRMSTQAVEKLRQVYGLDRPILWQYKQWVQKLAVLDFGRSFVDNRLVKDKIAEAAAVTLMINGLALLIIFSAGIYLGVVSAERAGSRLDRFIEAVSLALFSTPSFWLALLLIFGLGVGWRVFPVTGLESLFAERLDPLRRFADLIWHLILPVTVASAAGTAGVCRYMRSQMIEALNQPYIRTAVSKGLTRKEVLWRHALPNALLPVITLFGLSIPSVLGGSVILETVFSIPGMGRLFFQAVFFRDYPVVMGILVIGAVLTLGGNLLADCLCAVADPRIRQKGHL
ncbi:MAG: ABC transporter permease [Candidatus Omnitrophota bacterium]